MAEKKKVQHTFVSAADGAEVAKPEPIAAAPVQGKKGAAKYRLGAIGLWLAAIACEVLAVLLIVKKIAWEPNLLWIIVFLVADLGCVIGGSLLWKKSNRLDPASEKNKVKFWLWNNMGVIVCTVAFIPFVIIALTNKQADKKTKAIAVVVALVACLVGGLFSYDWNPISAEEKAEQIEAYGEADVYWTEHGKKYHLYEDCYSLDRTEQLYTGTVEQAIEANRVEVCKICDKKFKEEQAAADSDEKDVEIEGETEEEVKGLEIGTEETEEEGIALGIGG